MVGTIINLNNKINIHSGSGIKQVNICGICGGDFSEGTQGRGFVNVEGVGYNLYQ
jgi:hypothetical protein